MIEMVTAVIDSKQNQCKEDTNWWLKKCNVETKGRILVQGPINANSCRKIKKTWMSYAVAVL